MSMFLPAREMNCTDGSRFKERGFTFLALNPGWANTDLAGEGMGAYVSYSGASLRSKKRSDIC
jgi:hypothetical protein